jgi:hypothetical protein
MAVLAAVDIIMELQDKVLVLEVLEQLEEITVDQVLLMTGLKVSFPTQLWLVEAEAVQEQ